MSRLRAMLRAIPTLVVWMAFVITLDLPRAIAVAGVVTAVALAWQEEQKEQSRARGGTEADDLFDDTPPLFYL